MLALVILYSQGVPAAYGRLLVGVVVLLPLLTSFVLVWRMSSTLEPKNAGALLLLATTFFTVGSGLLIFPIDWLPQLWVLFLIGCDLVAFGWAIAVLDAFNQGERVLLDAARSLAISALFALLFGAQVALVMLLAAGSSFAMVALLFGTFMVAIAVQTFSDQIQLALDRLAFARFPLLRQVRADLRETATALPRASVALDLEALDEGAFLRLVRSALSRFGDLPHLAASPLVYLPAVEARLAARGGRDDALERSIELKSLLAESVARLKPRERGDFGTSNEWRHYNALYFPYIMGLRPYSRNHYYPNGALDPVAKQALTWFQTDVPERTLYNWQTAATRLVAEDLRGRNPANTVDTA